MDQKKNIDIDKNFGIIVEKINSYGYNIDNVYKIKMNWYVGKINELKPIEFYAQIQSITSAGHIISLKFIFLEKDVNIEQLNIFYYPKNLDFYNESTKLVILNLRKQFKPKMNIIKSYYEIIVYKPSYLTFNKNAQLFWKNLASDKASILIVNNSVISTPISTFYLKTHIISSIPKNLIDAVINNNIQMVKYYLSLYLQITTNKVSININTTSTHTNSKGDTALMIAVKISNINTIHNKNRYNAFKKKNLQIVELLIKCGADINCIDTNGNTPLLYALKNNNLEMALLILKYDPDINCIDKNGNTPLLLSLTNSNYEIIKVLLRNHNLNIFKENKNGTNALMFAAGAARDEKNIINFLVANGMHLDYKNAIGQTALTYAVKNNNIVIAKYLLDNSDLKNTIFENIETFFKNNIYRKTLSPLEIAVANKDKKMFYLLIKSLSTTEKEIILSLYDLLCKKEKKLANPNISIQYFNRNSKLQNAKLNTLTESDSICKNMNQIKSRTKNKEIIKTTYTEITSKLQELPIYKEKLKILETKLDLKFLKGHTLAGHCAPQIILRAINVLASVIPKSNANKKLDIIKIVKNIKTKPAR